MASNDEPIRDWTNFEESVNAIFAPWKAPEGIWETNALLFRGQSDVNFEGLIPTLLREARDRSLTYR